MAGGANVARAGRFRGWWVIAGLFVVLMMSSGLGFYAQSPFLKALVKENGFSAGLTGAATGLFFLSSGVTGYLTAGLVNRVDVRWMICVGAVLSGVALTLLGQVHSEWQMFAVNAFFGVGFALCGLVPATTVVTRWFVRRRSVALSVTSTGLSAGGIVVTRWAASAIDAEGLAAVTPWLALLWVAVTVPVALLLVRSSPQSLGQLPDGDVAPPPVAGVAAAPAGPPPGATFAQARATRFYQLLTVSYVFVMLAQVGALAHQNRLGSVRVSDAVGALAVSVTAGASVVGRLAGGVVVTRVSSRWLIAVLMAVQGVALLLLSGAQTRAAVLGASLVLGLSVGNLLMLQPLILAETFGIREYSRVYSFSQLVTTVGVGLGPMVLGFVDDASGYGLAYALAAGSSLVALLLFVAAGPANRPDAEPAPADAAPITGPLPRAASTTVRST